jgi:hypothetical protein
MKLRHAAALALVGWYLMLPPFSLSPSRKIVADLRKPLSQWVSFGNYDTAVDCNKEIDAMDQRAINWAREHGTKLDLAHAQCIATDDPRLKGN